MSGSVIDLDMEQWYRVRAEGGRSNSCSDNSARLAREMGETWRAEDGIGLEEDTGLRMVLQAQGLTVPSSSGWSDRAEDLDWQGVS